MANQMRNLIRERLAAGEPPAQVVQYFVDKYGDWILLEPRRQGFTLLVWLLPPLAVVVGLAIVAVLVRRWTRRRAGAPAPPRVDPGMSERIRREMEGEGGRAARAWLWWRWRSACPSPRSPSGHCSGGTRGRPPSWRCRPMGASNSSSGSARFSGRFVSSRSSTRRDTSLTTTTRTCARGTRPRPLRS